LASTANGGALIRWSRVRTPPAPRSAPQSAVLRAGRGSADGARGSPINPGYRTIGGTARQQHPFACEQQRGTRIRKVVQSDAAHVRSSAQPPERSVDVPGFGVAFFAVNTRPSQVDGAAGSQRAPPATARKRPTTRFSRPLGPGSPLRAWNLAPVGRASSNPLSCSDRIGTLKALVPKGETSWNADSPSLFSTSMAEPPPSPANWPGSAPPPGGRCDLVGGHGSLLPN
jgi:hypothetical protein